MPRDAEARVKLKVVGQREVQRAAAGITRDTRRAQQEQTREAQRAAKEQARIEREKARRKRLIEREILRTVREAEREKRREQSRTVREAIRDARRRAREEARAARERAREEQRAAREATGGRGAALRTAGAVAAGVGVAGLSSMRRAQGVLGIQTKDEALRRFIGFQQQLIQTGSEAGLSDADIQRLQQQILQTSRESNVDPFDLLGGLTTAQARFDKLEDFRENLGAIARVAKASGASLEEVIGAAGEAQRAFGLSSEELEEFLNVAFLGARRGSIEFKDIANSFSNVFGSAAAALGRQGIEGTRETLALAQVLGTSGQAPAEVATMTERTLETLLDKDVQQRFRRAGIELADSEGRLRPLDAIAQQLARNRELDDPRRMQELVGGRIEARRGLRVLRQRAIDNPELFGSLQGISQTEGAAQVTETLNRLMGSASGRAESAQIERVTSIFGQGDRLVDTMTDLADPLNRLENEFPLLTSAVEELRPAIYALIGAMAFNRLTGGGGGVAGGAARGLLARGAGAAATGAGGGGGLAALGGGSLLAGGAIVAGAASMAATGYYTYDQAARAGEQLEERQRMLDHVERQITATSTPEELDANFARARELRFGERQRQPVPSGSDALLNSPFFRQQTPTVQLDQATIEQLRQQGLVGGAESRRDAGGPARRTP